MNNDALGPIQLGRCFCLICSLFLQNGSLLLSTR